eukprot:TRINITY_DN1233_c0_g1_i11.p1 TRINITY_DN1233_c0_g1~~TRINITY_DN1233_c0_g1_i11.p1  ORF type:complete len:496 (-),score=293.33 TRINITY_DN1233_c0_g1_i11:33-1520(-)
MSESVENVSVPVEAEAEPKVAAEQEVPSVEVQLPPAASESPESSPAPIAENAVEELAAEAKVEELAAAVEAKVEEPAVEAKVDEPAAAVEFKAEEPAPAAPAAAVEVKAEEPAPAAPAAAVEVKAEEPAPVAEVKVDDEDEDEEDEDDEDEEEDEEDEDEDEEEVVPVKRETDEEYIKRKWAEESAKTPEERRAQYKVGKNYVTLDQVASWKDSWKEIMGDPFFDRNANFNKREMERGFTEEQLLEVQNLPVDQKINSKVSLWKGNICCLEIDAIQNAANESLLGGGGIDGAIHSAAGRDLVEETRRLGGCDVGQTKISRGYKLPATHVVHTVGPRGERPENLRGCYRTSLDLLPANGLRSLALCGVSTGIFGYHVERATPVAMHTVRKWLEEHGDSVDRVIFVVFLDKEFDVYKKWMTVFFPVDQPTVEVLGHELDEQEDEIVFNVRIGDEEKTYTLDYAKQIGNSGKRRAVVAAIKASNKKVYAFYNEHNAKA